MRALTVSLLALGLVAALPARADEAMAKKYLCLSCHVVKGPKTIGPAYADVAKKYAGQKGAEAKLFEKVRKGGSGVWGQVPMPPNPNVPDADLKALIKWILSIK
ncbi:MAG TPA: c-type cytochrome [Burkholderiales bacterium]|nr:c-type cytochrome [Burkholderiales bacterium]